MRRRKRRITFFAYSRIKKQTVLRSDTGMCVPVERKFMRINIGSPGRRGGIYSKLGLDVSRGLAECDFPAYIGGNFKNLIPTRLVPIFFSLSLSPSSTLLFTRKERERDTRDFQRLTCSQKREYSSELHGIISFAARSRPALCSLFFLVSYEKQETKELLLP